MPVKLRVELCECKPRIARRYGKAASELIRWASTATTATPRWIYYALEVWREPMAMETRRGSEQGCALTQQGVLLTRPDQGFTLENANNDETSLEGDGGWETVKGLEDQQRTALAKIASKGVLWKHPSKGISYVLSLHHGGDVDADGNCLFTASQKAMHLQGLSPQGLRSKTVAKFRSDYMACALCKQQAMDSMIKNLYYPDLTSGWGVHVVQEIKLLVKKSEREALDTAIKELEAAGMSRKLAAETMYKERCIAVEDGQSWAKYMSVGGNVDDEHDIITLQYTEEGLLTVDENRDGRVAAFGDDIAIESLATEFEREIFVVQAHGTDAMVDEHNCIFFLPHPPRGEIRHVPTFLFMKGTGWCGAGADHYEPLIARSALTTLPEKAHLAL